MRILLTGGTGFLGKAFLRYLRLNQKIDNFEITVLSSGRTQIDPDFNVDFMQLDLTNASSIDTFSQMRFDAVVHLATTSTLGPQYAEFQRYRDITMIDNIVLRIAKKVEAKQLIWASSGAVYGAINHYSETQEHNKIMLDDLFNVNAYRIGKIQSEYYVAKFAEAHNINVNIIRLFSFAGVDLPLRAHFALGNFIGDALTHGCINVSGTGLARRSYLNQDDFAAIVEQLLLCPSSDLLAVNIGSSEEYTLSDVASIVRQSWKDITGKRVDIKIHNKFDDRHNYYVPDTTLMRNQFPNMIYKNLQETCSDIIKNLTNN